MEDLSIEKRLRSAAGLPADPLDDKNKVVAPISDEGKTSQGIALTAWEQTGRVSVKVDPLTKPVTNVPLPS